ncbi:MAG: nitronate monooxygenase [Eggerthellaceae bacterium]|nr:nitronate monooxygenase [Eggerthellaceae bacterium]
METKTDKVFTDTPTITTRVTEILGIEYPIVQGAMAWIANAQLAAAVSNGGGLGIIACGAAPIDWVKDQIETARKLTDKPFGVNIMLMNDNAPELAKLLADMKVDVITTGAGSPANYMEMWKEAGCKVVPVIASAALAKRMERYGADAVVAEGTEAGGHIGELTTMALTPAVCDAISIPVITAGGVADGRGMAAAFSLGAEGVQVGTRFLTAFECTVHQNYKNKILGAKDSDTVVTGRPNGHPVRALKNKFARNMRTLEQDPDMDPNEIELMYAGSLHKAVTGDVEEGSIMAGQVACLINDEKAAADIIANLMREGVKWSGQGLQALADANAARKWEKCMD